MSTGSLKQINLQGLRFKLYRIYRVAGSKPTESTGCRVRIQPVMKLVSTIIHWHNIAEQHIFSLSREAAHADPQRWKQPPKSSIIRYKIILK